MRAFASETGFEEFKKLLHSNHYTIMGKFLKDYLKSKLLSKQAFSVAINSDSGSKDAIFDALWTTPGLYFVLACSNRDEIPKIWRKRVYRSSITNYRTPIFNIKCRVETQFRTFRSHEFRRTSPLCPEWQQEFFQLGLKDLDLDTHSHTNRIYNELKTVRNIRDF